MMRRQGPNGSQSGFSLVELMVAVSSIGILAALAMPILSSYRDQAKIAAAKSYGVQIQDQRYLKVSTLSGVSVLERVPESGEVIP